MSTHYNAFISYKHADLDNKVAAYVEKSLEHFHIPRKIRKKTGVNKIERIFRDTDELPITSDLSSTIEEALNNADYLIVICSHNTSKSMWVEREINFFLQTHPKENILTVLADGEPADVVPDILKNKEVTRVNENGETEVFTEPVEPLSCNFRLPRRIAKNTEIPRLAAALIGCAYNELMDRQRQYKMKRLTAIFVGILALAISFGAYMFNSKQQISKSYREALISQSKYLANESGKLLDNEQRIDALHLALAALPNEKTPDRPVTVEAVRAITQATMAYTPIYSGNMASEWVYELPDRVTQMRMDPSDMILGAMDDSGNVKVWDWLTHKELYSYSENEWYKKAENIGLYKGNIIILGTSTVISANPRSGEVNWDTGLLENSIVGDPGIYITANQNFLIALNSGKFLEISSKDGSIVNTYSIPKDIVSDMYYHSSIDDFVLSPDGTKIAFRYTLKNDHHRFGIYDIPSGEVVIGESEYNSINAMSFSNSGNLCLAYLEDSSPFSKDYLNMTTIVDTHQIICCVSPEDMSVKWEKEFVCNEMLTNSEFVNLEDGNTISYYSGNAAAVYNASSGEVLHHYNLNSPIVYGFAPHDADIPCFITESGLFSSVDHADEELKLFKYFTDDLYKVMVNCGVYAIKNGSNKIIFYYPEVYDEEWESFKDAPPCYESTDSNQFSSYLDDDVAVILDIQKNRADIQFYNSSDKSYITSSEIVDKNINSDSFSILGKYKDELIVRCNKTDENYDYHGVTLYYVNYKTGSIASKELDENTVSIPNAMCYSNGKLLYAATDSFLNNYIVVYDIEKDTEQKYIPPYSPSDDQILFIKKIFYFEEQGYMYYAGYDSYFKGLNDSESDDLDHILNNTFEYTPVDYIITINSDEPQYIPVTHDESWNKTEYVVTNDSGTLFAMADGNNIAIHNNKGEKLAAFSNRNSQIEGFVFYNDPNIGRELLIVSYSSGKLYRYDAKTGELLYKNSYSDKDDTYFFEDDQPLYKTKFIFDKEHSCMYMHNLKMTNIFDLDTFTEIGCVKQSLGYHAPTDTFLALSLSEDDGYILGYFNHYTLKDLIRKAKDILGDHELSQDQKDAYGIN